MVDKFLKFFGLVRWKHFEDLRDAAFEVEIAANQMRDEFNEYKFAVDKWENQSKLLNDLPKTGIKPEFRIIKGGKF